MPVMKRQALDAKAPIQMFNPAAYQQLAYAQAGGAQPAFVPVSCKYKRTLSLSFIAHMIRGFSHLYVFSVLAHMQALSPGNAGSPYHLLSNGTSVQHGTPVEHNNSTNTMPRIQLLSNNVDNVNYYDENQQVLAGNKD